MRHMTIAALLVALAGPARAADAPAEAWKGTLGAGVILLTGNTNTTTFNGAAAAQREFSGWILGSKASGVYGRSRPVDRAQPAQTVALAASGQLRADRKFAEHFTVYALGGADTDHVASVEVRGYGEGGLGYAWLDRKWEGDRELFLRTDLGVRYVKEWRRQFYATDTAPVGDLPDLEQALPRAGAAFRYAFSKEVVLTEDAEVLASVSGGERYLAKSATKLVSRLFASTSFGLMYAVTYDSAPAPGKVRTDSALGATLEVAF